MRERGSKVGNFFPPHFSLLIATLCMLFSPAIKRKPLVLLAQFTLLSGPGAALVSPGTFLACSAGLSWIHQISPACSAFCALPWCPHCLHASPYCPCATIPHICHCLFGDIYILMLICLTKCIPGCGCFCCYKMCDPHSAASWAVLQHLCLVPRQANTNFMPCFCFSKPALWQQCRALSEELLSALQMQHVSWPEGCLFTCVLAFSQWILLVCQGRFSLGPSESSRVSWLPFFLLSRG